MTRPRFSEILHDRRLEMGVSTAQASHVLRLKEQVLIAFEEGDFENIPKSGYAQGMLSSYARYLGLNPSAITDQFTRDLAEWEGGLSPRYGDSELERRSSAQANSGARGLLPTSGGYAGDMAGFSTVSSAHTRSGSLPLVNARQARDQVSAREATDAYGRGYNNGNRPYTTREPRNTPNGRVVRAQDRRAQGRDQVRVNDYGDSGSGRPQVRQRGGSYRPRVPVDGYDSGETRVRGTVRSERDRVTTRRVSTEYVDDLRYDDPADPYEAASTRAGRVSSRNIAAPARPNVRRRQSSRTRSDLRRREQPPSRGGFLGFIDGLFSDSRRATFVILGVLGIAITVIIISSVGSCVSNAMSNGRPNNVPVSQTQSEGSSAATAQSYTPSTVVEGSADAATTTDNNKKPDKVEVTVSVADGGISWIEITLDGESKVAETKTGPWSETYTVTDAIKIEASDPSVVTVSQNGEKKSFDKKASGVGTITIQGVPLTETDSDTSKDEDADAKNDTAAQHQAGDVIANGDSWDPDWNMWYSDTNGDHYDDEGNHYTSYAEAMAAQQSKSSQQADSSDTSATTDTSDQ